MFPAVARPRARMEWRVVFIGSGLIDVTTLVAKHGESVAAFADAASGPIGGAGSGLLVGRGLD